MRERRGFTLIELLVVVAIIALLIAILVPTLNGAREQAKKTVCLAGLANIGKSFAQYSTEDDKEHAVPIQAAQLDPALSSRQDLWITWWTWGGTNGRVPFNPLPIGSGTIIGENTRWAARNRPLNRYIYGSYTEEEGVDMPMFQCPSDTGYAKIVGGATPIIDDFPNGMRGIPIYDLLGNSYRGSFFSYIGGGWAFTMSPLAHRLSTLTNTSTLVIIGEPLFFNMLGTNGSAGNERTLVEMTGWHKRLLTDNLLYVDGSARATRAVESVPGSPVDFPDIGDLDLLIRGTDWRLETYPTPGAHVRPRGGSPPGGLFNQLGRDKWPMRNYQNIMK